VYSARPRLVGLALYSYGQPWLYSASRLVVQYPHQNESRSLSAKYKPGCSSYRLQSQIFAENRDFSLPHLHSRPSLGGSPSEYCHDVRCGKTRMMWLPDGGKISKISFFVLTECTNVTDGQTDGRTDTAWRQRPRLMHQAACGIARQKWNRRQSVLPRCQQMLTRWRLANEFTHFTAQTIADTISR